MNLTCTDINKAVEKSIHKNKKKEGKERKKNLITSRMPSAIMNISLATSPFRQIMSPGVKIEALIFSTRS